MRRDFKKMISNLRQDIYRGYKREANIAVISVGCITFSLVMFAFAAINFFQGYISSLFLSLIMAALFLASGLVCWIKKNREVPGILCTIGIALACTVYTIQGTSEGFAILWTTLVPMALMYFIDVRFGIYISLYFELLFIVCFLTPVKQFITGYSPLFMSRYPLLYLCIVFIDSIAMIQYHNNTLDQFDYDDRLNEEVEKQTRKAHEKSEQVAEMSLQMMETLANAIDAKDTYTKDHSYRVSRYAACLARALGWGERRVNQLRYDALVHDIGKIGIPDAVLNKQGKLTDEEFEQIKFHTIYGYQIFENATNFPTAKFVARHHHERYDGNGYPDKKKGTDIPENARIVGIADAFDAMSSDRVYRKALPMEKIRDELIKGAGTQFDPDYVKVFIKLIDEDLLPMKDRNF